MLETLGRFLAERVRRWMPDPFVFAILLTLLVGGLAIVQAGAAPIEALRGWYRGFWNLLEFGMQAVLLLATGFAIALSPLAARGIDWIARRVNTPSKVYFVVVFVGGLFSLVSWGWGVLTAVLARELAQRVPGVHYAFLIACVYFAGQPWVGGLSSSIPLMMNTPNNFLIEQGILTAPLSTDYTLGTTLNFSYLAAYFLLFPALLVYLRPRTDIQQLEDLAASDGATTRVSITEESEATKLDGRSPSDRLNHSVLLAWIVGALGLWYIVWHFGTRGFDINLNIMIFIFIMLGLVVHGTPMRYVIAVQRACANVSGIIFQYPFYAGIMGIMLFTPLGQTLADALVSTATLTTLPVISLLTGALVNFAIPSAGGEWAVVGPTLISTAQQLGAELSPLEMNELIARVSMSVAYGETTTNLLQPFFMLVILPIMGAGVRIQARDVMGYLVLPFLLTFVISCALVTWVPL